MPDSFLNNPPCHPHTTVDDTHEVEMEVIDDGDGLASPHVADNQKVKVKRPNDPCAWPKNCVQNPRGISTDWQQFIPRLHQAVRDIKRYTRMA